MTITAVPDVYSLPEGGILTTIASNGVIANDTTDGTAPIVPVLVAGMGPAEGSLSLLGDGSFTYTPSPTFSGVDSFEYFDTDNTSQQSAPAKVTLYVNPVSLPPTAVADSYTFTQGSPLVSSPRSVLDNDISPQGKVLTAQLVGKPSHGSLGLNPDGTFTYTPDPNSTSSDSFSYDAVDAGGLASQPTTVTLVEASPAPLPPTSADDSFATAQEKTISIADPGVLANDTGSGTAPLIAVLQANAAHGTLQLSGGGGFSYTPDPGFHGVDSFSYLATQGGLKAASTATVTIDVSQVFHAAVAVDDLYAGSEGQALSIPAPGVLANDTIVDSPAPSITASLVAAPLHGTVALQADGSFVYTPGAGFSGPDSFSYRDLASGLTGNVATVSLTVAAVAPPPSANPVAFTTTEGQPINVAAPGSCSATPPRARRRSRPCSSPIRSTAAWR